MVAPPSENELASTARKVPEFRILLGDTDGNAPEAAAEPEVPEYQLLTITRTAGGRSLDEATFERDLGALGEKLVDLQTPAAWARQVEVWLYPADADSEEEQEGEPLFWGELTSQQISIDQGEKALVRAQVQPYHFGEPLRLYRAWDPANSQARDVHGDIVFNPMVDSKIVGNQSATHNESADENVPLFLDPESSRTPESLVLQDDGRGEWTLETAIRVVSHLCNEDATFVTNLSDVDFESTWWDDAPAVLNLPLRRGQYLPAYLDAILIPHGFSWYLRTVPDDSESTARWITVFKLGEGNEKEVYLQRPGEELDVSKTNTLQLGMEVSVGDLANKIYGHGSLKEYEVTIELYRGWPEVQDDATEDDLRKSDPDSDYSTKEEAWRLWVGNEAGDYCSTRTTTKPIPATALDLSAAEIYVPKRRVLGPTLVKDDDGRRKPPVIEWYSNGDSEWQLVPPEWGAQILDDQIGVRFTGDAPPGDLIAEGDDARLRISGTIQSDTRLTYSNEPRGSSPNLREAALWLDLSDRFHFRERLATGDHASTLTDTADTTDDADDLEAYCDKIRDVEDSAVIRASIVLHGILLDYEIGDLITRVDGREISFNRNSDDAETKRYLQVMGIMYDRQQQTTSLIVEPQG